MSVIAPRIKPELAAELVKLAQQGGDLWGPNGLFQELKKAMVDQMLEAEMDDHLGFGRGDRSDEGRRPNSRNGHTEKSVKTETGTMTVRVPRDRDGSFTPRLIPKNARRLEGFDQKLLSLYARGMTTREIQGHLEELYGTEVSPQLISEVTESVLEQAKAWQSRPLEAVYPIVYLDALFVAIRDGGVVVKKAIYVALGMSVSGQREVLGLWFQQTEGAKFWLSVMTDLKNRGVQDIFFVCCDGLKGFPDAIGAAFPLAIVQTCVVHVIRASLRFVSYVDRKALARELRPIYGAATEADAAAALDAFEERWGAKLSRHRSTVAEPLERNCALPRLPRADSKNPLHDERHRVAELPVPKSPQPSRALPLRRRRFQASLSGSAKPQEQGTTAEGVGQRPRAFSGDVR
jgi:putative transposase